MSIALVLAAPRALTFEESEDPPLAAGEVRIRTLCSGISAGTELSQYRGTNPFMNRRFDEARRLFVARDEPRWTWPVRNLGYEEAGEIVEIGSGVADLEVGQRVYGTWNHRTHHVAPADYARERLLPDGADPRIGIFSHIGAVALNGVHDARIRIGDLVAVFGLGVPGQIVVQAARASGGRVVGIDPDPARRETALRHGAVAVRDPGAGGAAEAIKDMTGGRGADVCIEVSGAAPALADAIRAVAYASRVVVMGFFQGEVRGLELGAEYHHNRVELVCSQISGVAPEASHRWSKPRLWRTAIELQHEGVLDLVPLITHVAPFAEAPALFARLDAGEPGLLQAMLVFAAT
ncbi:zinc-binding dehydrogenase [Sphingosinicella sp. LHD-64]|uniref:zinc-binding dehydrogenase n=1 Tax=Sphingosinicella sp. LHD-64 TaxID=3072139 RepID=UPI0028101288|nr:zinc-binding dehydrogenase [Sphingosinicella sp. LHD-64]MDQ8757110.1 zinc-binding dehydrogenase [Sphingosinicella sp. LHD-64]